jgi:predicted transcriptional regulator
MCAFKEARSRMALRLGDISRASCTLFIAPFHSRRLRIARALRQICRLCSRTAARVLAALTNRTNIYTPSAALWGEYLFSCGERVGERFNFWRKSNSV